MKNTAQIVIISIIINLIAFPLLAQECPTRFYITSVDTVGNDSLDVHLRIASYCEEYEKNRTINFENLSFIIDSQKTFRVLKEHKTYEFHLGTVNDLDLNFADFEWSDDEANINSGNCNGIQYILPISTSYGSPLNGPYQPGEEVVFEYFIEFDNRATACQWIQGLVPDFSVGWNRNSAELNDMYYEFERYNDFEVNYKPESHYFTRYTDEFGVYRIADIGSPIFKQQPLNSSFTPLPMGWFCSSLGTSPDCTSSGLPNDSWGLRQACNTTKFFSFEISVTVNDTLDIFDCQEEHFKALDFRMYMFADGETGCWVDTKCIGSTPFHVDCDLEGPIMPGLKKGYNYAVGSLIEFDVEDPEYIINDWSFGIDTIPELISNSSGKRSEAYFEVIEETGRNIVFKFLEIESAENLEFQFNFNVVKEDNPAYIYTSDLVIDICERFVEEIPNFSICQESPFYIDLKDYLLKEVETISYIIDDIVYDEAIINIQSVDHSMSIEYRMVDHNGCVTVGSIEIQANSKPSIDLIYNDQLCYGEFSDIMVNDFNENYIYTLLNCDGEVIDTGLQFNVNAGCYILQASSNSNCFITKNIEIISDSEYLPIINEPYYLCGEEGEFIRLEFIDFGYEFIKFEDALDVKNGTINFFEPGIYPYTYSNQEGYECFGTSTIEIKKNEPLTHTNTIVSGSAININQGEIDLIIDGGEKPYTYEWLDDGTTKAKRSNLLPGVYTVLITDLNGCILNLDITVPIISAVETIDKNEPFLYPNPAHSYIELDNLAQFKESNIELISSIGEVIYIRKVQKNKFRLMIENINSGIYFIRIKKDNKECILRFVKI